MYTTTHKRGDKIMNDKVIIRDTKTKRPVLAVSYMELSKRRLKSGYEVVTTQQQACHDNEKGSYARMVAAQRLEDEVN